MIFIDKDPGLGNRRRSRSVLNELGQSFLSLAKTAPASAQSALREPSLSRISKVRRKALCQSKMGERYGERGKKVTLSGVHISTPSLSLLESRGQYMMMRWICKATINSLTRIVLNLHRLAFVFVLLSLSTKAFPWRKSGAMTRRLYIGKDREHSEVIYGFPSPLAPLFSPPQLSAWSAGFWW